MHQYEIYKYMKTTYVNSPYGNPDKFTVRITFLTVYLWCYNASI